VYRLAPAAHFDEELYKRRMHEDRMRIRVVVCNSRSEVMIRTLAEERQNAAGSRAVIEMVGLPRLGPPGGMECWYEEAMAGPYIIAEVQRAQQQGCSGVVLDCMLDPCLWAARQAVTIPVVGPGQATLCFASCIAERFSLITVENTVNSLRALVIRNQQQGRVLDVSGVNAPLGSLVSPSPDLIAEMTTLCQLQIEKGAEAIVLACTGMSKIAPQLAARLPVPVIDPGAVAVKTTIDMVELGIAHSKAAYPLPPVRQG
jgi:allantoin racemase